MLVLFYDIEYDDGHGDLPSKLKVTVDKDTDLEAEGADIITDETGFLVISFLYQVIQ